MKTVASLALLILALSTMLVSPRDVAAQDSAATGPVIAFEKTVHDYGTIEQGANGQAEFKFTNRGTDPLILSRARGSCGCTVPTWPKEPIAPGASATILVNYDTKRVGPINKSVTVTSNCSKEPMKVLRIKGSVVLPEESE